MEAILVSMNEIIDQVLLKQYGDGDYVITCGGEYQKRLFKKLMLEVLEKLKEGENK